MAPHAAKTSGSRTSNCRALQLVTTLPRRSAGSTLTRCRSKHNVAPPASSRTVAPLCVQCTVAACAPQPSGRGSPRTSCTTSGSTWTSSPSSNRSSRAVLRSEIGGIERGITELMGRLPRQSHRRTRRGRRLDIRWYTQSYRRTRWSAISVGLPDTESLDDPRQIDDRRGLHLLHDSSAADLDGNLGDTES